MSGQLDYEARRTLLGILPDLPDLRTLTPIVRDGEPAAPELAKALTILG